VRALFKREKKDDTLSRKVEMLDLKFEVNSTKLLQFEQRISDFEERLAELEDSNVKLAKALMNLIQTLKDKERSSVGVYAPRASARADSFSDLNMPQRREASSLSQTSIENEIIGLLKNKGSATPSQMQTVLNRSREHISRILKALTERRLVERQKAGRTFVYSLPKEVDEGKDTDASLSDQNKNTVQQQ